MYLFVQNEGYADDNNTSGPSTTPGGLEPSESLEEVKSRVHALLDDAFSLISNSYSSIGWVSGLWLPHMLPVCSINSNDTLQCKTMFLVISTSIGIMAACSANLLTPSSWIGYSCAIQWPYVYYCILVQYNDHLFTAVLVCNIMYNDCLFIASLV